MALGADWRLHPARPTRHSRRAGGLWRLRRMCSRDRRRCGVSAIREAPRAQPAPFRAPARPRVWVGRAPLAEHPSGRAPAPRTCSQLLSARLGAQDPLALAGPGPACVSSPCRSRARAQRCGGRGQSGARPGPARR